MNEIFHRTSPYAGCTASAPLAFVTCYRTACKMPEYAQIDMSTSVENLLLEADSLGLGAVWLGIAPLKEHMEAIHNVLQISQDLVAFSIVPCGYPDLIHIILIYRFISLGIQKHSRNRVVLLSQFIFFVFHISKNLIKIA